MSCTVDECDNVTYLCGENDPDEENDISDCGEESQASKQWMNQTRINQVYDLRPAPEHKYPWLVSLRHRATEERPRNGSSISMSKTGNIFTESHTNNDSEP